MTIKQVYFMLETTPLAFENKIQAPSDEGESWTAKLAREGHLFSAGLGGFGKAASEAFTSEQLPATITKGATGLGIALAMTRFLPSRGILGVAAKAVGVASAISFG